MTIGRTSRGRPDLRRRAARLTPAPHYHPSEIILGNALAALKDEYPRESYTLITKAGKYGPRVADHDYSPDVIKASVERSLRRLQTDYLDVVCELSQLPLDLVVLKPQTCTTASS